MTFFTVYIDESGDEGFTFRDAPLPKGSSDWFVLSAVIIPTARDHEIQEMAASLRAKLGMQLKAPIHFSQLTHEKRVRAVSDLAALKPCISSVIINKREMKNPEVFAGEPFRLYFYAARLLLERISWYCRDATPRGQSQLARIVFEHRKRLSYDDLRGYLRLLSQQAAEDVWQNLLIHDVRIDWRTVDPKHVQAAQKAQFAGLQLADLAASGLRWALEYHQGCTEHRFAKLLAPVTYKYGSNFTSYGLKFFPVALSPDDPRLHWVKKYYG